MARGQGPDVPVAEELPHDGQAEEHLGEHVVVRAPRWCLGVVFREAQPARLGNEEGVEPGDGAGVAKAGWHAHQLALPVLEPELRQHGVVGEGGRVRLAKGAEHDGALGLEKAILRG